MNINYKLSYLQQMQHVQYNQVQNKYKIFIQQRLYCIIVLL